MNGGAIVTFAEGAHLATTVKAVEHTLEGGGIYRGTAGLHQQNGLAWIEGGQ